MSKIEVDAIEPQSGTTLTVGASGDTVTVPSGVTFDASNATTTLPSNVVTTTGTQTLTNKTIDASQLTDSTISLAKLSATGTKDATTFLRGDNTFAEVPAGGITEADQWRIIADHTGVGDITANWERNDTTGYSKIGTGMTESSGIFTFPNTGIWLINFNATGYAYPGASRFILGRIRFTTDNSTYSNGALAYFSSYSADAFNSLNTKFIFDVTNTTTHKIKFDLGQNDANTPYFLGETNANRTHATFIKLGDT